ncbi:carbon storage regulator [Paenalkalicoccus suaedae]|uniref:Carbon storage regulator n=1 Tax=Paenalkalicoccus suaedae TaxID=2592382 RepID=A0A859FHR6_9BACI|nr:carbon storage regulator [Paenalkalicoccus suaedae]QKS72350.1 carbon storage regulator [Paenalkalicoccus suaedae]
MLVIGRKVGESVVIDDRIRVEVIKSQDGKLRLGIEAPRDIKIERGSSSI